MVERQIRSRGLSDPSVLEAMQTVPRHCFVPSSLRYLSYQDMPLPIGWDQTISQPYMVAVMTAAAGLSGTETVLEIGTGSGYAAAVLGQLAAKVYTIERIPELAERAEQALQSAGCGNVFVLCGDGTEGLSEQAPFDAIIVTAGAPHVPDCLRQQLKVGGVLIIPVGDEKHHQTLLRVTRTDKESFQEERLSLVSFVPLIGADGWEESGRD